MYCISYSTSWNPPVRLCVFWESLMWGNQLASKTPCDMNSITVPPETLTSNSQCVQPIILSVPFRGIWEEVDFISDAHSQLASINAKSPLQVSDSQLGPPKNVAINKSKQFPHWLNKYSKREGVMEVLREPQPPLIWAKLHIEVLITAPFTGALLAE